MARFTFYINDQALTQEPKGWEGFEANIVRDEDSRFIGVTFPLDLEFVGDGYTLIKSLLATNGRAHFTTFRVVENNGNNTATIYKGIIKLSEGVDRISSKVWSTPVRDNTYSAFLRYSLDLKINLLGTTTRSGLAITPVAPIEVSRVFDRNQHYYDLNVASGTSMISDEDNDRLSLYDVKDVLEYMISFLSDNGLTFRSNWYDGLADDEQVGLISGKEAHIRTKTPLVTTLGDMIKSVGRIYNLFLTIEDGVAILETEDYFLNAAASISLTSVDGLESAFDEKSLYSIIKIGDPTAGDKGVSNFLPQIGPKREFFAPLELYMRAEGVTASSLNLQPVYITNSSLLFDTWFRLNKWPIYAEKYILNRIGESSSYSEYDPNKDTNDYYSWLDDRFSDHIFLVQYDSDINQVFVGLTDDGTAYTGNHELMNDKVLPRYKLGGDIYASETGYSSFRLFNNQETIGFGYAQNNAIEPITFYNFDDAKIYDLEGGQNIIDDGSAPLYYRAPVDESKTFSVSVMMAAPERYYPAVAYDGNPRVEDNDAGVYFMQYRVRQLTISAVQAGDPTIIILDQPPTGWAVDDSVSLNFYGDNSNDWAVVSPVKTITAVGTSGAIISVDLDSSSYTDEMLGGTATFGHGADLYFVDEPMGQVNVELFLYHYDSDGTTLLDTTSTSLTEVKHNTVLRHEASFDLDEDDIIRPSIRVSTSNTDTAINWVYLPLEFRDNVTTAHNLYTTSPQNNRGEILSFDHPVSFEQRQAILNAPFKAIGINGGKGWPKKIDINFETGKASFDLITNKTYFNPDANT